MDFDFVRFSGIIVNSMADAIIYADVGGNIQFWNSGAVRIFGYVESEVLGKSLDIIIPEALRERHWDGFKRTMLSGESHYEAGEVLAVPAICKDGMRISVEFTIVPFLDEAGKMVGIAAVMRDVTKQFNEMKAMRKGK